MNDEQRKAAIAYAGSGKADDSLNVDVRSDDPDGFDEVEAGVWVRSWVFVPKDAIPGYNMTPPASASVVEVVQTLPKSDS